ncbi:CCR4-NOT transcription complex subunit 1-like [Styela clava]
MNLDSLSLALSHISYLVANLSKKNYKSGVQEILQLTERHGPEADRHLFRCLFSSIDFGGDGKSNGKDYHQTQLLILQCSTLATKPGFISILCHSVDSPFSHQKSLVPSDSLLTNISRVLKFTKVQEVTFAIALQHSSIQEVRKQATEAIKTQLPELIRLHLESVKVSGRGSNSQDIGLQDTAIEVLHLLLSYLAKDSSGIVSPDKKQAFLATLRSNFPIDRCPIVLLPLLYREKEDLHMDRLLTESTGSIHKARAFMADVIREIGYSSCSSVEECRKILVQYGVTVNASQVARVLGMMASTISEPLDNIPPLQSLSGGGTWSDSKDKNESSNSWNVEAFVQAVKDLNPNLSFQNVMKELDYPSFIINNAQALLLVVKAITFGIPPKDLFPTATLYQPWKNSNGQLSWIQQSLLNPGIFCFADHPCHLCAVDILKQPLDEENKEILNWKSLDLVECLLQLSQNGHYEPVKTLFMWPMKHCPDLLMLSLLQLSSPFHKLRQELISNMLPTFLNLHPNSGIILHYAWHGQGQSPAIKQLVMLSMAEWYMRDQHDQQRLSRILDVAQDLKALSHLLNASPFAFVIDLAVLASRREYLKLDKWLTDKIREHGEHFIQACVAFLKRRCPSILGVKDDGQPKNLQLPPETLATVLVCLQACVGNVSQTLSENILTMVANCSSLISKTRQAPPGVMGNNRQPGAPGSSVIAAPASNVLPETSLSKTLDLPGMGAFSGNPTQQQASTQQSTQQEPTQLPGFGGSLHVQPPGSSAFGMSANDQSMLSATNLTPSNMLSTSAAGNAPGLPASSNPLLDKSRSTAIGPIGGGASGTIGQLNNSAFSSSVGQNLASNSFGLTGNNSSANQGIGGGPFSSQLGFDSQMSQGFGASNQLLAGLGGLSISGSATDSFSSSKFDSFGGQKLDMLNRKVQDLFGQSKQIGLGNSGGMGTGPSLGGGLGGSLGGGMGTGLGVFGQKKTNAAGSLGAATQQAFQQAAVKSAKPAATGDLSQVWPEMNQQFSKEIEDEANSYFQKIYNQPPDSTLTVDEILDLLRKFKDSTIKKEREVFNCMIRNLFEEYRFFPQYPDKELYITACLFGGIIEKNLVTYLALGIALRYVLEALRKPQPNKMYYFGIAALDRFKNKLREYPQYCLHIAGIPHFKEFPPHLVEYVDYGKLSKEPPMKAQRTTHGSLTPSSMNPLQQQIAQPSPQSGSLTPTRMPPSTVGAVAPQPQRASSAGAKPIGKEQPSIAKATNIDTLLGAQAPEEKIPEPPESAQDKIAFIFNNLSSSNIQAKSEEMQGVVEDEYIAWLSQYFVMKRVSIEPNFHQLYSNFLECLRMPKLTKLVHKEVFRNITVLLKSDKIDANFSDRSLLKNLGHFLGMLTLPKNKPILFEDIDLKSLLYEANMKGAQELLYVVPFVAKILESVGKSRVFKLPNPWTEAIIGALVELHNEPDLKLNLKFEVEVLCKNLQLDINEIKPSNYLRDPSYKHTIDYQLSASNKDTNSSKPGTPSVGLDQDLVQKSIPPPGVTLSAAGSLPPSTTSAGKGFGQTMPQMLSMSSSVPRFSLHDINIYSISTLQSHLMVKPEILKNVPLITPAALKSCVRMSVERAVQELLQPVVDRAIKIAMTTCEQIVKKDFALDPEEFRMRAAAHHMVRNLTAGMALITCREPLIQSITNYLKINLPQAIQRVGVQQPKELIEQAATVLAQDNMELACCFIQKTAIEKAFMEIDKRMATEFELRKHARQEGRRYCDSVVLTYQAERMPEQIRLKVGGVTPQQTAVYEEFARCIPGFLPSNDASQPSGFLAKPMQSWPVDEITQVYDRCIRELEQHIQAISLPPNSLPQSQLQNLLEATAHARNSREIVTALALLQKAVEGLLERLTLPPSEEAQSVAARYRECHILVMKALQDQRAYGPQWTNKHVTRLLVEHRDEYKYNVEAVDLLIKTHLVNLQQYDMHLAQSMENGLNYMAVQFAMQLVKLYLLDEKQGSPVTESDLYNTIEMLVKINTHTQGTAPEGLSQLITMIRSNYDTILDKAPGGPTHMMHSGISQAREYDDPPGLNEKTEYLLREWVNIYHSPTSGRDSTRGFSTFVQQMHQQGILRTDDLITRFFRLCTELCVDLTYRLLQESNISPSLLNPTLVRAKCFHTLDAFVRLITLLVKHSGDAANSVTKINLLNKVLGIVVGVLQQDHDQRQTEFHQMPYHRIFIMLFYELNAPEHVLESINFQTLTAFTNTYHILRPTKVPGFSFAWLELISYRSFISRMLLQTPQQKGWPMYAQLLIDLFKFLGPFLRNVELTKPMQVLYRGTLRLLLVLLHDFPEFLCDYHYGFCDVIPANCIQLRNLILSAFPRNMRLPDPFTPNLKVDMLQEINSAPRILTNFVAVMPANFRKDLDSYLKTRAPVTFLSDLRGNLQLSNEPGMKYNVALINSLVLYVGTQAIQYIYSKGGTPSMSTITHSSHMDIFQNLSVDLDTEGRYLFLNAIANQLRYPNSHTHYFSCTLLYLFAEANQEAIQEQITRVLLERLIVNRPHPWGLLITFIELIKNPNFKFWNHEFVHCAPEISKLFESVARSCMGKQFTQQSQQQTGQTAGNPSQQPSTSQQTTANMIQQQTDAISTVATVSL